ncbi:MAG: GAF domain-containing protein, partial [Cyanobacteria bacterium P01_A01_bin.83]
MSAHTCGQALDWDFPEGRDCRGGSSDPLVQNLSWSKVGQAIVEAVVQLVDVDIAILHLNQLPSDTQHYFFHQKSSPDSQIDPDLLKLTVIPYSQVVLNKTLTINWHQATESQLQLKNYKACLSANIALTVTFPLFDQLNLAAYLTIHRFQPSDRWQQHESTVAKIMATQAKLMLSQMLAREKLLKLAHRETTINRITTTIRSSLEPPVMFAAIAKELGSALNVDGCTLSLWTKSDRFVQCVGLYNPHEPQKIIQYSSAPQQAITSSVPISENPILQALLFKKKTINLSDLEQQRELARYELPWHARARALMIVPLLVEDEIIGSITLRQSDASRNWTPSEIELAEAVADQAAIA